jgi:hypothetical protein
MKNMSARLPMRAAAMVLVLLLSACASVMETQGPPRKENIFAVTASIGFDFNPAADRIRVVSGRSTCACTPTPALPSTATRAHPVPDAALAYASGDRHAGQSPPTWWPLRLHLQQADDKLTTNFALDRAWARW